MCKRPIGWAKDETVDGAHCLVAVTCDEYTIALEDALSAFSRVRGADSSLVLAVRQKLGLSVLPHDKLRATHEDHVNALGGSDGKTS